MDSGALFINYVIIKIKVQTFGGNISIINVSSSFILVLNIVNNPSCVVVFLAQCIHEQPGLFTGSTGSPGSSGQAAVLLWQQQLGGE